MKFVKKPVVVDAFELTRTAQLPAWARPEKIKPVHNSDGTISGAYINTLEGTMFAQLGDWIIEGLQGEIYPCKPDIFKMTYEPVRTH